MEFMKLFYTVGIVAFSIVTLTDVIAMYYNIEFMALYSILAASAMVVFHGALTYLFIYLYRQQNSFNDVDKESSEQMDEILNKVSQQIERGI